MIPLNISGGLPFISMTIGANGQLLTIERVLVDTGSTNTSIKTDILARLGVVPTLDHELRFAQGVGGFETVLLKPIEKIQVGHYIVEPFSVLLSGMNYGLAINAILGADFLIKVGASLDFRRLQLV
jgi:hypothetical protein